MSAFTDAVVKFTPLGGRNWRLETDMAFYVGVSPEDAWKWIHVPAGFETDFDSTPFWARWFLWFLLWGRTRGKRAHTLHDWLYRNPGSAGFDDRGVVDMIWFDAMLAEGVPYGTASRMHRIIVSHGDKAWNKYRRRDNG